MSAANRRHVARRPFRPATRGAGFTLIEILVVVVILAVLAAALALSASGSGERQLEREAEQARALIVYACEQAELRGREIGVSLSASGYRFSAFERDVWSPLDDHELRSRRWVVGTSAGLARDGQRVQVADALPEKPQLVCFSSGELTPFQLDLALGEIPTRYRLKGEPNGDVTLSAVRDRAP